MFSLGCRPVSKIRGAHTKLSPDRSSQQPFECKPRPALKQKASADATVEFYPTESELSRSTPSTVFTTPRGRILLWGSLGGEGWRETHVCTGRNGVVARPWVRVPSGFLERGTRGEVKEFYSLLPAVHKNPLV